MQPEGGFTAPAGWVVQYLPETGSTNDLARQAGEKGAPEKTVFVAGHQTRGRGRMDRSWLELPDTSLLFSILLRRHLGSPFLLSAACSVAGCEAVETLTGLQVEIKWPNDLMLEGRKLAGVLTESNWSASNPFSVVGMGINVNFDPTALSGIPGTATSLLLETGRETSRQQLLREILLRLDDLLAMSPEAFAATVRSRWSSRLWRRRQRVVVADGGKVLEGIFEGVAEDGTLLLRLDDGSMLPVRAGDLLI